MKVKLLKKLRKEARQIIIARCLNGDEWGVAHRCARYCTDKIKESEVIKCLIKSRRDYILEQIMALRGRAKERKYNK